MRRPLVKADWMRAEILPMDWALIKEDSIDVW
jgi:hypothetical protein